MILHTHDGYMGFASAILVVSLASTPIAADHQRGNNDENRSRAESNDDDVASHNNRSRYETCAPRRFVAFGRYELRWVPPIYQLRYSGCGRSYRVLIHRGYYKRVWVPRRYVKQKGCRPERFCGATYTRKHRR